MNNLQKTRIVYLDSMRGILMLLVVCYHAALVFKPNAHWVVNSNITTEMAYGISEFLGLFIMPLFFMISGYFALFSVHRYTPEKFILKRLKRIIIPLFTTALTLNILQSIISKNSGWYEYYINGAWISHLWFLWNLAFYFIFIYFALKFFKFKFKYEFINLLLSKYSMLTIIFLLPLFSILLLVFGKLLPATVIGISVSSILYYFPYFIFGILILVKSNLIQKFIDIKIIYLILLTIIAYILYYIARKYEGIVFLTIGVYFQSLAAWFLSSLSFKIFYNYINKPSKILNILSEASYSMYLLHQVIVVLFAVILIKLEIGGMIGLVILVFLSSTVSLFIHMYLISKIKLLKFLYNGI